MQIKFLPFGLVSNTSVNIFLGRRKSGKTVAIFSFLEKFKNDFKCGLIFCGSVATALEYSKIVPRSFIYPSVDTKLVKKFIARQERGIHNGRIENTFILLDDCGFDSKQMNNKVIKSLFQNGRHYKICLIISLQYCLSIGPSLRSNCDFLWACREKSITYRAKLYEHFNICFKNLEEFDNIYRACTTNYDIFVMANALPTQSDLVQDNCFYWKANFPAPAFKINRGGRWWQLDEKSKKITGAQRGVIKKLPPQKISQEKIKNNNDLVVIPRVSRNTAVEFKNRRLEANGNWPHGKRNKWGRST